MSFATAPADDLEAARRELARADLILDATPRRAARREAGAADVSMAEYRIHGLLERVRALEKGVEGGDDRRHSTERPTGRTPAETTP